MDDARFDIVARAPENTPQEQTLLMLRALLADRFKLVLHREQRVLTVLALVTSKNGPKFREAADGSSGSNNRVALGVIISNRITMSVLATLLSRFLREPVLDETDLNGPYDIRLEWTSENRPSIGYTATTEPPSTPDHPSIYVAVQEQLGLKLERRKGPLDVLVVDHADRTPIAN